MADYAAALASAVADEFDVVVCAIDRQRLIYPDEVVTVVARDDVGDYRRAARVLVEHAVDAVLILHDEDVFGGPSGSHAVDLADELTRRGIPYLVSLQSVRRTADPHWVRTVSALNDGAARVLVFTDAARRHAVGRGLVRPQQVAVLPMGVLAASDQRVEPSSVRPAVADALAALAGRRVVTTVNAVGPDAAIDWVINSLPKVAAARPDLLYVLASSAEPEVGAHEVELHREQLRELVLDLHLGRNVCLIDVVLTQSELAALLSRTEVYLAPDAYPGRAWRALSQAVAAGCSIVAAAHPHSSELLGAAAVLTTSRDIDGLSDAVGALLDDQPRQEALRVAARALGEQLGWPAVAPRLATYVRDAITSPRGPRGRNGDYAAPPLPLRSLAGIASDLRASDLRAFDLRSAGRRAAGRTEDQATTQERLSTDLVTTAYAVLGLCREARLGAERRLALTREARVLNTARREQVWRGASWPWFTHRLGGEAARLPQALILAGRRLGDDEMVGHGLESLDWYSRRVGLGRAEGVLRVPTSLGSGAQESELAVDAAALVEALVEAYRATGRSHYGRLARRAFDWFGGVNRYAQPVYRHDLGMCREGLSRAGWTQPYTPTATLAYAGALVSLASADLVPVPAIATPRHDLAAVA